MKSNGRRKYNNGRKCINNDSIRFDVFTAVVYNEANHSGREVLRQELSSTAQTLRSWVRIPLEAWMSVRLFRVRVVVSVGTSVRLFRVRVVQCIGRGLEMGCSSVQGVFPLSIGLRI
jgi:hypothetical protein